MQRPSGELLYVVKGATLGYHRKYAVVDANGEEVFRIYKRRRVFGSDYHIRSSGRTVGKAGSNWCWSRGRIEITELPPVCCKYGWGMRSTLVFIAGAKNVASVTIQRGIGVRGTLLIEDTAFDGPRFLIGCALVFQDWTSRG